MFDEGVTVLFRQVHALDALALKACLRLVQAEVHEKLVLHRLLVLVEERRRAAFALKDSERVAVNELGRRGGEADHPGVEVFHDFGEALEDGTVRLIENDQVEEAGVELGIAQAQSLLRGDEQALGGVDLVRVNPVAGFVRQVGLEAVRQRLVHEGIAVGQEQHFLGLVCPEEKVDEGHRGPGLARAGGHDQQGTALLGGERLGHAPDGFVLVRPVHDGRVDGHCCQGQLILPEEQQPLQVVGAEEAGHEPRVGLPHFPEVGTQAVGHEAERRERLVLGDFGDVVAKLLVRFARVAAAPFGFDHAKHMPARFVEAIVRDAVPGFGVVPIDGDFKPDLAAVVEPPARRLKLGVNESRARRGFTDVHENGL